MENLNNLNVNAADVDALVEADLFADELEDHFNNAAAGTSTFSSVSTTGCLCTFGCFCCAAAEEVVVGG